MSAISVVVPVYNVESYLSRCINSVLNQTYKDFDLILIDDGSIDCSGKICDEYAAKDNRIKVIHQQNGGLSVARNAGIDWSISNSSSSHITFIDSDDFVSPKYLEELNKGIALGVKISCVCCKYITNTGTFSFGLSRKCWHLDNAEEYWLRTDLLPQSAWGKLYDKQLLMDVRYPVGRLHEDEFTTHKLLFGVSKIATSRQHLYYYCLRKTGITGSTWSPKRMDSLHAYEEQCDFFKKLGCTRAFELARGRMLHQMMQAAINLSRFNIDKKKSAELESAVRHENELNRVPFWENRDLYRNLEPRQYKLKWFLSMIGNAFAHGTSSWLIQDGIGTIRQALYPPTV